MSVKIEHINVLVPVRRIEDAFPGGVAAYERRAPNDSFDCDGELTRIAFGSGREARSFAYDLERLGLRFDPPFESDIAMIDADSGDTGDCPWVELVVDENLRAVEAELVERELPGPPDPWES